MQEKELEIDIRDVGKALYKKKKTIAATTIAAMFVAGAYLLVVSPTYESTSLLRVQKPQGIGSSLLESVSMGNSNEMQQLMSTYAEIMKSRPVIEPVVEQTEEKNKDGKYPPAEVYAKSHLVTLPLKNTQIMQIKVTNTDPEKAKKVNDLIVDTFLQRLTELERTEQRTVRMFIEQRAKESKKTLYEAEDKLTKFKQEHKVLAPDSQVKLAADKLSLADKLKAENQIAKEAAEARYKTVNEQLKGNAISIAGNTVLSSYQQQLAGLETKRIELLAKYTEKHPDVVKVTEDIAGLRRAMNKEVERIVSLQAPSDNSLFQVLLADKLKSQAAIAVANGNLAAVSGIEGQYKQDVEKLSETEQEYLNLMRDVTVAQEIYTMLAKRAEEAKVAETAISTDIQIVDRAHVPERPIKPRKKIVMLLAMILGFLASSTLVVAKALLSQKIVTKEDVEQYLDLPVLGQVTNFNTEKEDDDQDMSLFEKWRKRLWE